MWLMFQEKILWWIISPGKGIEAKLKWRRYGQICKLEDDHVSL